MTTGSDLPTWVDCSAKADAQQAPLTALERFILDNEPADLADEWRDSLAAVLTECEHGQMKADAAAEFTAVTHIRPVP
jgi:hypothetical protein